MSLVIDFALLCVGFFLLTKGADYFIENSASFAEEKGISPHVVGVTIVAFGTSLPELLVSIISSFQNYNDLALGNIVGSNISNIGLVLAVSTFIFHYVLGTHIVPDNDASNDSYVMLLAVFLLFSERDSRPKVRAIVTLTTPFSSIKRCFSSISDTSSPSVLNTD